MNYCFIVKKEKRKELAAIIHADNTCRIQTVCPLPDSTGLTDSTNSDQLRQTSTSFFLYFKLISEFYRLSGIPCILDTSFNLKGEPIVESPEQAVKDFLKTKIDILFIGSFVIHKKYGSSPLDS